MRPRLQAGTSAAGDELQVLLLRVLDDAHQRRLEALAVALSATEGAELGWAHYHAESERFCRLLLSRSGADLESERLSA